MNVKEERVKKLIDFAKEYGLPDVHGDFPALCRKIVEIFEPLYKDYKDQKVENAELKAENERLKTYRKNHRKVVARLKSKNEDLKKHNDKLANLAVEVINKARKEERRDTAYKILNSVLALFPQDKQFTMISKVGISKIAKQFDVDIKE